VQYLTTAGQCELHPFYYILRQLTECFITSYGGVRSHATLLPHARVSNVLSPLQLLFPLYPIGMIRARDPLFLCLLHALLIGLGKTGMRMGRMWWSR
jgi:hypothetical protein